MGQAPFPQGPPSPGWRQPSEQTVAKQGDELFMGRGGGCQGLVEEDALNLAMGEDLGLQMSL